MAADAHAGCVDGDSDGYDTGTDSACVAIDCNDADADIHPAAAEDLSTDDDDDCDGTNVIYQMMEAPLANGAWWNVNNVTFSLNQAILEPTGGSAATMELKSGFDWDRGELHVRVGVSDFDGPSKCTVGAAGDDKDTYLRALHNHDDRAWSFPDRPVDITFYELPGGDDWEGQVYGFLGIYELPDESGSAPGFDSAYGDADGWDLDQIPFGFAPLAGLGDFQQTTTQDVAFCEGCRVDGTDAAGMAFGAVADHGIANYFGPPSTGAREPGNLECHFANFTEVRNVDPVEDETTATLWGVHVHAGADPPRTRAISKATITLVDEDDVQDWDWCYETTADGKAAFTTSFDDEGNGDEWVCKRHEVDTTYPRWPACDPASTDEGELLELPSGNELGNPFDIEALHADQDVALATFYSNPYADEDTADTGDDYDRQSRDNFSTIAEPRLLDWDGDGDMDLVPTAYQPGEHPKGFTIIPGWDIPWDDPLYW